MKKKILIIMAIFLMASTLCIPAFAADTIVLRVSALKNDGTTVVIENYDNFEDGWEAAIDYAEDKKTMENNEYDRIVVDFYADWTANDDGEFGDGGDGFEWNTIHITEDIRITLNLNNHTINRNLKEWENNGEVIYVDDNADAIINNGTIMGGWSCNGAGGIHMMENSRLTLNNVNIVGNSVDDDDGAGIAVYDGAVLNMKGGCVSHNASYNAVYGGGVYVNNGNAVFTDVTFENNQGFERSTRGAAVCVDGGTLTMEGCKVIGNGLTLTNDGTTCLGAYSIIDILNVSKVVITETQFLENGYAQETHVSSNLLKYTSVISSQASYLTIEKCGFFNNNQVYLIESEATVFNAFDTDFSQNKSFAFYGNCADGFDSAFTNCKFDYNGPLLGLDDTFFFNVSNAALSFIDCNFGNATFNNKSAAQFVDSTEFNGSVASILGEGSLVLIVSFIALITSVASLIVNIATNKNMTVPVTETESSKDDD